MIASPRVTVARSGYRGAREPAPASNLDSRLFRVRWRDEWLVEVRSTGWETVKSSIKWTRSKAKAKTFTLDELIKVHHVVVAGFSGTSVEQVEAGKV